MALYIINFPYKGAENPKVHLLDTVEDVLAHLD